MPFQPGPGDSSGSAGGSESMFYPTKKMIDTAHQMLTNANSSLEQHSAAWTQVQGYVQNLFGFMQGPIMAVLTPYERRLRNSYQWQAIHA